MSQHYILIMRLHAAVVQVSLKCWHNLSDQLVSDGSPLCAGLQSAGMWTLDGADRGSSNGNESITLRHDMKNEDIEPNKTILQHLQHV